MTLLNIHAFAPRWRAYAAHQRAKIEAVSQEQSFYIMSKEMDALGVGTHDVLLNVIMS